MTSTPKMAAPEGVKSYQTLEGLRTQSKPETHSNTGSSGENGEFLQQVDSMIQEMGPIPEVVQLKESGLTIIDCEPAKKASRKKK